MYSHDNNSFIRKGRVLRKKCGLLKTVSAYLHSSPLFLCGRSDVGCPTGKTVIIPSIQCIQRGIQGLLNLPNASNEESEVFVYLQTCISAVLETTTQKMQRLCKRLLFENLTTSRLIFFNENLLGISSSQRHFLGETWDIFENRLFLNACMYLSLREYGNEVQVLLLDEDDPLKSFCEASGILFRCLDVQKIEGNTEPVDSLAALGSSFSTPDTLYRAHEPESDLKIGLRQGIFVSGRLSIYKHSPFEGEVEIVGSNPSAHRTGSKLKYSVLVHGRADLNRALDGDDVVICLHPREKWRASSSRVFLTSPRVGATHGSSCEADPDGELEDDDGDDESATDLELRHGLDANSMPTGFVVGIARRSYNDIIAVIPIHPDQLPASQRAFSDTDTSSRTGAACASNVVDREEYVVVIPHDRRLPKLRVRTRQWKHLGGQKVICSIDSWPRDSMYPNAHFVRTLGDPKDWRTEVAALMIQNSIFPRPFSPNALACLPHIHSSVSGTISSNSLHKSDDVMHSEVKAPEQTQSRAHAWVDSGWRIAAHYLSGRRDFREVRNVFSVDPPGCQDIDDAMSVRWVTPSELIAEEKALVAGSVGLVVTPVEDSLKNYRGSVDTTSASCGQPVKSAVATTVPATASTTTKLVKGGDIGGGLVEVSVCIADVCAFLEQGCALDLEAQARGTTVYLPHCRFDMLPSLISSDIASLHGSKDRLAVTVTWNVLVTHADGSPVSCDEDPLVLDAAGDIVFTLPERASWVGRTVIHSIAAMTYGQAHNLIQGDPPDFVPPTVPLGQAGRAVAKQHWPVLRRDLKILTVFARFLKRQRQANGAIDITQGSGSELKFKFDSEGTPMDMHGKEELEVHSTIEQLMILANSAVARIVHETTPREAVVRIHPPPTTNNLDDVKEFIARAAASDGTKAPSDSGNDDTTAVGGSNAAVNAGATAELSLHLQAFRGAMARRTQRKGRGKGTGQEEEDEKAAVALMFSMVVKAMNEARYVAAGTLSGQLFASSYEAMGESRTRSTKAASSASSDAAIAATAKSSLTVSAPAQADETAASGRMMGHYGLGLVHYTHFTSPIRRYADVLVHRQILAIIAASGGKTGLMGVAASSASQQTVVAAVERKDASCVPDSQLPSILALAGMPETGEMSASDDDEDDRASLYVPIVTHSGDTCGDLLDDLLGDVGEDLSSTLKSMHLQPPHTAMSSSLLSSVHEISGSGVGVDSAAGAEADFDDLLDSLLSEGPTLSSSVHAATARSEVGLLDGPDDLLDSLLDVPNSPSSGIATAATLQGKIGYAATLSGRGSSVPATAAASADTWTSSLGRTESNSRNDRSTISGRTPRDPLRPYSSGEIEAITQHLNEMNRRSKQVQMECQKLFLGLYFRTRVERHTAIIFALRANGFIAYVPAFDHKGAVFLANKMGNVCLDPSILGLEKDFGSPAPPEFESANEKRKGVVRLLDGYECFLHTKSTESSMVASPATAAATTAAATTAAATAAATTAAATTAAAATAAALGRANSRDDVQSLKELVVMPSSLTADTVLTTNEYPPTAGTLKLRAMQSIVVEVTAVSSGARMELRLSLVALGDSFNSDTASIASTSSLSSRTTVESAESRRPGDSIINAVIRSTPSSTSYSSTVQATGVPAATACKDALDSSLYAALLASKVTNCISDRVISVGSENILFSLKRKVATSSSYLSNPLSAGQVLQDRAAKRREKVCRAVRTLRHEISGTGRLSFGSVESLRPLYQIKATSSSGAFDPLRGETKQRQGEQAALASLGAGRLAAQARMAAWGEEWAAEEDLPDSYRTSVGGGSGSSSMDLGSLTNSEYRKQIQQSTQRERQIKASKKSSKFK